MDHLLCAAKGLGVSYNTLAKLLNEAGEHEKVLSLQRAMLRPDPLGETVEGSDHPYHDDDDDDEEEEKYAEE